MTVKKGYIPSFRFFCCWNIQDGVIEKRDKSTLEFGQIFV